MVIVVSAAVAGLLWWAGHGSVQAVEAPTLRAAPKPFAAGGAATVEEGSNPKAPPETGAEERIGDFGRPEGGTEYEILDERRDERDGARGSRVMVDTRSHSEEEYVLITCHLKARFSHLDTVSVEFIDLTETLRCNSGALIFNTPASVDYIGYVYGSPNSKGYYTKATPEQCPDRAVTTAGRVLSNTSYPFDR